MLITLFIILFISFYFYIFVLLLIKTYKNMKQFRIINRTTKEEQVFNSEQLQRFFFCEYDKQTEKIKYNNEWKDYAVSYVKPKTEKILFIINCLAIVGTSLYLLSQWI